jgi:hypothetical protein
MNSGIVIQQPWGWIGCVKGQKPELAPYPPSEPMPNEAAQELELARLTSKARDVRLEEMKLAHRRSKALKIELGPGFWLGAGLCAIGGTLLLLKREP